MFIKIDKGTPKSTVHLCDKCVYSRSRTHGDNHVERQCAYSDEQSHWARLRNSNVVECSVFHQSGDTSFNAMQSIAWQWHKNADGDITFVDTNARNNPQLASTRRRTRWQRFAAWIRRTP